MRCFKYALTSVASVLLLISAAANSQDANIRDGETFSGSNVPDEVAFDAFLDLLAASYEKQDGTETYYIAKALGLNPIDPIDAQIAAERAQLFRRHRNELAQRQVIRRQSELCADSVSTLAREQIIERFDKVDNISRAEKKSEMESTFAELSGEEREALRAYLVELKNSITYTRAYADTVFATEDEHSVRRSIDDACRQATDEMNNRGLQ